MTIREVRPDTERAAARRYARLTEVVLAALARPAAERDAYVGQACADDPGLGAQVRLLLAEADRPDACVELREASEFLGPGGQPFADGYSGADAAGRPAGDPAGPAGAAAGTADDAVAPGYRLVRILGEGGMGTVYEAEQRSPRRRVALKVVRGGGIGSEALRRFAREADVLGTLQHPGICQVHEVGRTTTGAPFLAMELVDGLSLTRHADGSGSGRNERLALLCRVCDAVGHAHERGIVHRDLKPDNILVTHDGRPKIVDFGIARATGPSVAATLLTTAGAVVGTVAYMSPEQAAGQSDIDARTDVFALGVIGFELLTGTRPAQVDGLTLSQALHVISQGDHAAALRHHPELRGDVETILAKALERDPGRRYGNAGELAADLRRHLLHEPIVARPPSIAYRVSKFTRRHRTLVTATVFAFLALGIGTGLALQQARRADANSLLAAERAAEAERQAYRATLVAVAAEIEAGREREALRDLQAAPAQQRSWVADHLQAVLDQDCGRRLWEPPVAGVLVADDGRAAYTASLADDGELLQFVLPEGTLVRRFPLAARPLVVPREAVAVALQAEIRLHPEGVALDLVDADGGAPLGRVTTPPWDPGRSPYETPGTVGALERVQVSRTGDLVVLNNGEVVWDLLLGQVASRPAGALLMDPSPDGARLLGSRNERATVSDARTGEVIWQSPEGTDGTSTATFAADGRSVYTAGMSTEPVLRRWSLPDGAVLAERAIDGCAGGDPWAVSPDGAAVALAPDATWIRVFDADLRSELDRRLLPESGHPELALGPGATRLLAASRSDGLRAWDLDARSARVVLAGHARYVYALAFSPDGRRLASGSWDRSVRLWDLAAQRPLAVFAGFSDETIEAVAWSTDGRRLYVASRSRVLALDAETGGVIAAEDTGAWVHALALRPFASELLVCTNAGLRLLDPVTLQARRDPPGGTWGAWSPDGLRLATVGAGEAVVIRDAESLVETVRSRETLPSGFPLAWSPDGRRVARFDPDVIVILDAADGRTLVRAGIGLSMCFVWSPDGKRIVVGRGDGGIDFLDAATGQHLVTLTGHRAYVRALAFSPDGTTLASGSGDGDVRLWLAAPRAGGVPPAVAESASR